MRAFKLQYSNAFFVKDHHSVSLLSPVYAPYIIEV